jgi:hypothetical protein
MKKLIFLIALLPIMAMAQDFTNILSKIPIVDGTVVYSGIVKDSTLTKDEIYRRAIQWAVNLQKNVVASESEVKYQSKDDGTITISQKVFIPDYDNPKYLGCYSIHFINIYVKNGRYKYTIDGFLIKYQLREFPDIGETTLPISSFIDKSSNRLDVNERVLFYFDKKINSIIESLKTEINKKSDDNW